MMKEKEKLLAKADPILDKIILQVPKPTIESTKDIFHDMMSCLIEQQIHYRSTKRIFAKALERANVDRVSLDNFHLIEQHALSQIKLSSGKYETMMALIEYWTNKDVDLIQLSDAEVHAQFSTIKGIGKWTTDMILLYTLERPDVFPYDDFHLKQMMVSLYHLDPSVKLRAQMLEVAQQWGNQKSLAVLYLLAYKTYSKNSQ